MYAHTYGMYVCIRCVCVCIGWGYTVYVRKYVWRGGTEGVCFSLDEVITYYIEKRKKTDTQRVTWRRWFLPWLSPPPPPSSTLLLLLLLLPSPAATVASSVSPTISKKLQSIIEDSLLLFLFLHPPLSPSPSRALLARKRNARLIITRRDLRSTTLQTRTGNPLFTLSLPKPLRPSPGDGAMKQKKGHQAFPQLRLW